MTIDEYEHASLEARQRAWLEYEGRSRNVVGGYFDELRIYSVDDRLVVVCTDPSGEAIITCFHDHRHSGSKHRMSENKTTPVGERRERYRVMLRNEERGGMVKDLRILNAR